MQEINKLVGSVRSYQGGRPQKYVLDDYGCQLIISEYSSGKTLNSIARKLQVPRWKVSEWAVQLGLSRQSNKKWTEREVAYLKRNFYAKDINELATRLGRSANSVRIKAHILGLSENNGYNKDNIAEGLGVNERTVSKWVFLGWLKGKKRGDSPTDQWVFLDKDIRDFILNHSEEVKEINSLWVKDLLSNEVGMGELGGNKEKEGRG